MADRRCQQFRRPVRSQRFGQRGLALCGLAVFNGELLQFSQGRVVGQCQLAPADGVPQPAQIFLSAGGHVLDRSGSGDN